MLLYLLRHGIAESDSASGLDADRRLTDDGRAKTRKVVAALALRMSPPQVILSSPLVRARQTAELAGEAFGVPVEIWDVLGGNHAGQILAELAQRQHQMTLPGSLPGAGVMLVGHEPSLSEIIERLLGSSLPGGVQMKKAGCAALEVRFEAGQVASALLLWLTTPKQLLGDKA
ncbi:MAG: phosphohistidine phosphatase SixA [Phycisphaeraceae bacterium]|nr:phosphohistidine phosphatase SixA [Phycisphaeraceae bacterium]